MSAEDKLRELADRYGWPEDVVQDVRTLMAAESNAAFDHGQQVERSAWQRRGIEVDAARYQWIKARKGLDLRTSVSWWQRQDGSTFWSTHSLAADGTAYAAAESLDAMIDSAMTGAQP